MGSSLVAVAAVGVVVRCCIAAVVVSRCGSLQVSSFSVAVAFSVSVSSVSSCSCSIPAIPGYTCRRVPPGTKTGSNSVLRAAIYSTIGIG